MTGVQVQFKCCCFLLLGIMKEEVRVVKEAAPQQVIPAVPWIQIDALIQYVSKKSFYFCRRKVLLMQVE